ncbi:MAG: ATP-binding protein, partial [Candidatus Nanoarchaeia archaeon]
MEAGKIIEILSDYNYWGNFNAKLNEREAIGMLKSNLDVPVVNVVKGVRRSGKSSMVLKLIQELGLEKSTLIINLEDPRLPFNVDATFLMEALEAYSVYVDPEGPKLVVIDEAQHAYGWERFARYVVETKKIKCIVTGSSSQLLSEEYATSLTGRHIDLVVFPLSFSEFLKFKGVQASTKLEVEKNRLAIQRLFNEYIEFGGFPEVVLAASKETKKSILTNYFEDILIKDIVKRYKVKLVPQIESVAKDCLANIASIASMRRIANSYSISLHTVERFIGFFANAYLFFFIKKFSFSKRKQ